MVKAAPSKKELWILTMGDDSASESYVRGKIKDCDYCGIPYSHIKTNCEASLFDHISRGNRCGAVGGIIVQKPLPAEIDGEGVTTLIRPEKDVDGFRIDSMYNPCTPEGIMRVLEKEIGDLTGKRALVIGRGELIGRPIVQMLVDADCTVTIAHSKTTNLDFLLRVNDIVVCAVGKPNFLNLQACEAEIVIDCGINRDENGKLVGDCYNFNHFDHAKMKVTPVPGGVGLMTRAMLMSHMLEVEE
jgi:methylenetetrahydrofolate dehydrogenase (NADP+)/methenyltetrahydrofolate cyclohydrolase